MKNYSTYQVQPGNADRAEKIILQARGVVADCAKNAVEISCSSYTRKMGLDSGVDFAHSGQMCRMYGMGAASGFFAVEE